MARKRDNCSASHLTLLTKSDFNPAGSEIFGISLLVENPIPTFPDKSSIIKFLDKFGLNDSKNSPINKLHETSERAVKF